LGAEWSEEEAIIAQEFLGHARAIRRARTAGEDISKLIDSWGGVTIAYRRRLIDAPSYTLNHEEVAKALEEGIRFAEGLTPEEVQLDEFGAANALVLSQSAGVGERVILPARSILVAAGTQPNTVLQREEPGHVKIDGRYFQAVDETGVPVTPERVAKPEVPQVL